MKFTTHLTLTLVLLLFWNQAFSQNGSVKRSIQLADSLIIDDAYEAAFSILDSLKKNNLINPTSLEADRYHAVMGYYHFNQNQYDLAIDNFRPLLFKAWISEDKEFMAFIGKAINDVGIAYYRIGKLDSAEISHDRSLVIALEENDLQLQAYNYNNLAILYKNNKEYEKAMRYFEKGLEINIANENLEGQGYQFLNMAMLLHDQSQYTAALENYLKALEIFDSLKNDQLRVVVYDRIGTYYSRIKDFGKAIEYFNKTYRLALETNNTRYIARALLSLGRNKKDLNAPDSAIYFLEASLAITEPLKLAKAQYDAYAELGHVYKNIKQYDKALYQYNKALEIIGDKSPGSRIALEVSVAHVYNRLKRYSEAKELAQQALNRYPINKQTQSSLLALYGVLSNAEEALGNFESSLDYFKKQETIEDSIFNQEKQLDIARLEFKYELSREKEVFALENEKQAITYQAEIQEAEFTRNLTIAISIIVLIAGLINYRYYTLKRKANKELKRKARELEYNNHLLEKSYEKEQNLLKANLEEKERRMAAIAMTQLEKESLLQKIDDRIAAIFTANGKKDEELKSLQKLVKSNINMNNSWDSFLHQFEQIHPEFFELLRKEYGSLTVNDLKVCAYVKVGMDNKSIAQVTNTTLNTIKSRIHRIKKKLELGPEDSIRDFLMDINQTIVPNSSQGNEAQDFLSGNSLAAAKASN